MSRTHSDNTLQLVKSLTKSEKRYFRLFAAMGQGSDPAYLQLFDFLERANGYNADKILRKIPSVRPSQLSNLKHHLYETVLESLTCLYSGSSVQSQLCNFLQRIDILYEKRLMSKCLQLLHKAKEVAYKYEKYPYLLELLNWEKYLLLETIYSEESQQQVAKVYEEESVIIEQMRTIFQLKRIYIENIRHFQKTGLLGEPGENKNMGKIIRLSFLKNKKALTAFWERYYYHNILGIYYMLKGDWEECCSFFKKVIGLMDSRPYIIREEMRLYVSALNVYLISCLYADEYKEFSKTYSRVRQLMNDSTVKHKDSVQLQLLNCYGSVLHFYIHSGWFEKGVLFFKKIESQFEILKNKTDKTSELNFYYTFARLWFGAGDNKKSLFWLNKILNDPDSHSREDIRCFARIFNLIIHYEIGNYDLLEHIIKSAYGFLKKHRPLFKAELLILNFLQHYFHEGEKKKLSQHFRMLRDEFEKLLENPHEKKAFDYFDFISWADSKMEGKSFSQAVREKKW